MNYLGIDPGASGGLVLIFEDGSIEADPMPDSLNGLADWISDCPSNTIAVVEKVHALPNNATRAAFKFGYNVGSIHMVLTCFSIPYLLVTPRKWMDELGLRKKEKGEKTSSWKGYLQEVAESLFPSIHITRKTADAFLIAAYCRRIYSEIEQRIKEENLNGRPRQPS